MNVTVRHDDLRNAAMLLAARGVTAGEPLALTVGQETQQALRLRASGLSYQAIAIVMREYHGSTLMVEGWRARCRRAGAPPVPYGLSIAKGRKAAA